MVIMNRKTHIQFNDEEEEPREEIPKDILVIAQEVKIVQALACNDVNKRNKQIRKLRKWLTLRAKSTFTFTPEDFLRIWKGLYYNMWMSDKPLVQEELAESLGQLVECFDDVHVSVMFFGAFLQTMCNEFFGIDQWRIDKFLMLVRRMLRYMFRVLRATKWDEAKVETFNQHIFKSVLSQNTSTGLTMHFLDIFFEELAKVSEGEIDAQQVGVFIKPFVWFLTTQRDFKLISHCRTRVFYHLLYQSALGREYTEKYNAWRDLGFPTASIDDLEKIETSSIDGDELMEEEQTKTETNYLDPRAGDVDVFMPELPLDGKYVINELELLLKKESNTKCRKMLKKLLEVFETYQNGEFPLGIKTMPRFEEKSEKPLIKQKILQLENMENEMFSTGRKLKQLNKRKRRKLLKSLNYADLNEENYEQAIEKSIPKQLLKGRKKKGSMLSSWLEEELGDVPPKKMRKKEKQSLGVEQQEEAPQEAPQIKKQKKKNKLIGDVKKEKQNTHQTVKRVIADVTEEVTRKKPVPKLLQANSKVSVDNNTTITPSKKKTAASEWDEPLADGEIEYFISSRKQQLKAAKSLDMVRNPFVKAATASPCTPKNSKKMIANSVKTPASIKRVKIALKHNTEQKPSEYINQIKSSPNLPYDANRKPGKGLLKPNSMPSPINPFYKKKIGLRLLNDAL